MTLAQRLAGRGRKHFDPVSRIPSDDQRAGAGFADAGSGSNGGTVTYTFTASTPGTRAYYSGTQGDLQVEMGMYGAIIVLPSSSIANYPNCPNANSGAVSANGENDFRLAPTVRRMTSPAVATTASIYSSSLRLIREIHRQAEAASIEDLSCGPAPAGAWTCVTEPYHPGVLHDQRPLHARRHGSQLRAAVSAPALQRQSAHASRRIGLLRIIGQGRWQHPFHEHGNHVRVLARDGNLIAEHERSDQARGGPLLFTTTTTPGQAIDGIFYWTGKGLNWDVYGHNAGEQSWQAVHSGCERLLHVECRRRRTTTSGARIT